METLPALPENLCAASIALQEITSIMCLSEWTWHEGTRRWIRHCRLTSIQEATGPIPTATDWYVLVSSDYPWGSIKFYPAKVGGITQTFPHQSYNAPGSVDCPWRTGDLCLNTSVHILNRLGHDPEPYDVYHRLSWHVARALEWLKAAATDSLTRPDDFYELPQFPTPGSTRTLTAFNENAATLREWKAVRQRIGLIQIGSVRQHPHVLFVKAFCTTGGRALLTPAWGTMLTNTEATQVGIWLRLDACPVLAPWQAPVTWGELRQAAAQQDVDLDHVLQKGLGVVRDGRVHFLFVGFPIPEHVGGEMQQMQWMTIELPILSRGTRTQKGFRPNAQGYWLRDRMELLTDNTILIWQQTENWAVHELTTRGRLPETVTRKRVLLIGGGALGSAIAELLVRTGLYDITIMDGEIVTAGNLVRHTLSLRDVRSSKAASLAMRLNSIAPHAQVAAVNTSFPSVDADLAERIMYIDTVIDCTGSDETLFALSRYRWQTKKRLFSLSLGLFAHRLFCFSVQSKEFSQSAFQSLIAPWLIRDRQESEGRELPREGIGCWHPVFPARADDIGVFAGVAVKFIEREVAMGDDESHLTVYEQCSDVFGFIGIRRVSDDE